MTLAYLAQLGLKVQKTNVGAQKIDGFLLETYGMVIAVFQIINKLGHFWFFQETFLLTNISIKVVLGISFLIFSKVDIQFTEKKLTWRIYITKEALLTTCWVKLIDWKKFAKVVLDKNIEVFVMYISSLRLKMTIYPAKKA